MTTALVTVSRDVGERDGSVVKYTWTLTSAAETGTALEWTEWADRTWTATGTWGGATLTIQGSNDGTNFVTLANAAGGVAGTLTADGGLAVIETPLWVRPKLTTAGVGASLTVILVGRRHTGMRK